MMLSCLGAALAAALAVAPLAAAAAPDEPPRLVLHVTVGQLRGDVVSRFGDRFGEGGFRHLLENGVHYANCRYRHASTETAPGHATLVTGASPRRHGIVGDGWIDRTTGAFVSATEDDRHHVIGADPRPHEGVSPRHLRASTIGDELTVHNAGRSRVFSVSLQDHGAILAGGHAGKAFWFSPGTGEFVTSTYYYLEACPGWVVQWNANRLVDRYRGGAWTLLEDRASYHARDIDDRPYEIDFAGMGRTFPHPFGDGSSSLYTMAVSLTPMGDELTLSFVMAMIEGERIGQGEFTDYLAVGFSSPDQVGRLFGASSLEYEDAVLRIDRLLARLLDHVDQTVGLARTLIVLSGDHGGVEAPEYMTERGLEAGRHPRDWLGAGSPIARSLTTRFGRDDLIAGYRHPSVYLDEVKIREAALQLDVVERFVAREIERLPGIAAAITRGDVTGGRLDGTPLARQVIRGFDAERSGHVHVVQAPYWFLPSTDSDGAADVPGASAIPGSPWAYDTFVPLVVAGPGIPRLTVHRLVGPEDLAPTIAARLGVKPPSASTGTLLTEVLP